MNVIVDTVIWSLAFRRQANNTAYQAALEDLIVDGRVALLASVRQEVLSGIKHEAQFEKLKTSLRAFPDMLLSSQDYELAAQFFNQCRRQGLQGANTDFLICAAAVNHNCEIFTTDQDFRYFAGVLPISLYQSGA
ncbi:MAG: PIN domain-containing protein [Deinococcota bacterium]